jgi:ABC-type sugar transport system permease subunit
MSSERQTVTSSQMFAAGRPSAPARFRKAGTHRRARVPLEPYWFMAPAVIMLSTVYLGPMIYAVLTSGTHWVLTEPGSETIRAGLQNYQDVLGAASFWQAVKVTLLYTLTSVTLSLTLGTLLALLLDNELHFASFFRSIMLIPMVITPAVIAIFWKLLYEQEQGVLNSLLVAIGFSKVAWLGLDRAFLAMVIMDSWQNTPFFMLVILAGLQSVDSNLMDAARVDGANVFQRFRYVTLPHLVPYMLIAAAFRGIATMNDFDKIWLLTQGGPGEATTTITVYTYKIAFSSFDMGRTTAIALIFVVIVLVTSAPLLRHLFRTARRPA